MKGLLLKMKGLLHHMRHRPVRRSTEASLKAAASAPNSGFTFVDNSQGASAAVAELSRSLDMALEEIDFEGLVDEELESQLRRLDNEAAKYSNSRLNESILQVEWNCSKDEAEVIGLAWECSRTIYETTRDFASEGFSFVEVDHFNPSAGGTIKATSIVLIEKAVVEGPSNPFLPLLVVAVRGTASAVDGMVNANGKAKEASFLAGVYEPDIMPSSTNNHMRAHAGFLNSTEALMATVSKTIADVLGRKKNVKNLLFTGHSAGGATASLLYLKYLSQARNQDRSSLRLSSITFGSPPVICPEPTRQVSENCSSGLVLCMINEYDMVTRADAPYVLSLVDLYRSIYSLPPIQNAIPPTERILLPPRSPEESLTERTANLNSSLWSVPEPEFWHFGKLVVLKLSIPGALAVDDDAQPQRGPLLKAFCVTPWEFAGLLFCRLSVHGRNHYGERATMIAKGRFNAMMKMEDDGLVAWFSQ